MCTGVAGVYAELLLWLGVTLLRPNPALLQSQICCSATAVFGLTVGVALACRSLPAHLGDAASPSLSRWFSDPLDAPLACVYDDLFRPSRSIHHTTLALSDDVKDTPGALATRGRPDKSADLTGFMWKGHDLSGDRCDQRLLQTVDEGMQTVWSARSEDRGEREDSGHEDSSVWLHLGHCSCDKCSQRCRTNREDRKFGSRLRGVSEPSPKIPGLGFSDLFNMDDEVSSNNELTQTFSKLRNDAGGTTARRYQRPFYSVGDDEQNTHNTKWRPAKRLTRTLLPRRAHSHRHDFAKAQLHCPVHNPAPGKYHPTPSRRSASHPSPTTTKPHVALATQETRPRSLGAYSKDGAWSKATKYSAVYEATPCLSSTGYKESPNMSAVVYEATPRFVSGFDATRTPNLSSVVYEVTPNVLSSAVFEETPDISTAGQCRASPDSGCGQSKATTEARDVDDVQTSSDRSGATTDPETASSSARIDNAKKESFENEEEGIAAASRRYLSPDDTSESSGAVAEYGSGALTTPSDNSNVNAAHSDDSKGDYCLGAGDQPRARDNTTVSSADVNETRSNSNITRSDSNVTRSDSNITRSDTSGVTGASNTTSASKSSTNGQSGTSASFDHSTNYIDDDLYYRTNSEERPEAFVIRNDDRSNNTTNTTTTTVQDVGSGGDSRKRKRRRRTARTKREHIDEWKEEDDDEDEAAAAVTALLSVLENMPQAAGSNASADHSGGDSVDHTADSVDHCADSEKSSNTALTTDDSMAGSSHGCLRATDRSSLRLTFCDSQEHLSHVNNDDDNNNDNNNDDNDAFVEDDDDDDVEREDLLGKR
jgi:hypothetical protein